MSKKSITNEIEAFKANGGKFQFSFGDIHLPVIYHEALGLFGVRMPGKEVFVPVNYNIDLDDNLAMLMDKLLDRYPQLTK